MPVCTFDADSDFLYAYFNKIKKLLGKKFNVYILNILKSSCISFETNSMSPDRLNMHLVLYKTGQRLCLGLISYFL